MSTSYAQLNASLAGNAIDDGDNCFIITQDALNQAGGVWFDNPIDFDDDFTIYYQNYFGSKDGDGADGMALVFKDNPTAVIGGVGGGVGYDGILPSLVVEFDTFQNGENGDPFFDHIGIMTNGFPNHNASSSLDGPIQASATSLNIEDNLVHEIKIEWIAATQILNVFFDCIPRLSLNFDVKNNIFSGDDSVFFGFVGSTGGLSNLHRVCFNSISFVDNLQLEDQEICENESVNVDVTVPSGTSYSWTPTTGVSNPTSPITALSPTETTTYTITIADVCGESFSEQITISVIEENPIFDPVSPICEGDTLNDLPTTSNNGVTGTWSPALDNTTTTTYTFTPDNLDCATTTILEIVVIPTETPIFNPVSSICSGDILDPLPTLSTNGYTGTWQPALDNTQTTTYTFTPDTGQGCIEDTLLTIIVDDVVEPLFDSIAPVCQGEIIIALPLISTNGITGTWSPALDNTQTTTYTFTPDSGQGCVETTDLTIVVESPVLPTFTPIDPACEGESIADLPSTSLNGISGSWSPAIDNTATTTYTFTPDTDECAISTTIEIIVVPIEIPTFLPVAPICEGDNLNPLPNTSLNGIVGSWSPSLDNTLTATYTFTPNAEECAEIVTLDIEVIPLETPNFQSIDAICEGEPLNPLPVTSTNGISGSWSPAIDNTQTTTYTFTPNADECAEIVTLEIVVTPIETPNFDAVNSICSGEALTPLPNISLNGISGTWSPALDNTQTTIYTFTPNADECASETTLEIVVNPIEIPVFDGIEPICSGETLEPLPTTSNNNITGNWSPELDNTITAIYTFTPDDELCAQTATIEIVVIPNEVPIFDFQTVYCLGDSIDALPLISENSFTGTWSPDINETSTTTYTFTPDIDQGCVINSEITITIVDPDIPVFNEAESICEGDILETLPETSLNGFTGSWAPELNNLETTTYTFTPDEGQCAGPTDLTIAVNVISELALEANILTESFSDQVSVELIVTGGNGDYEFQLNNNIWQDSNIFNNLSSNSVLEFSARQKNGCSNTTSEIVTTLNFPPFFTPNQDGFNDYWNIRELKDQPNAQIFIFDRYGKLLSQVNPIQIGWDGTYNGRLMPSQDYWFRVDFIDPRTGQQATYSNHFTLKR